MTKVSLRDALCGVELMETHLDGRELTIKTAPGYILKPGGIVIDCFYYIKIIISS